MLRRVRVYAERLGDLFDIAAFVMPQHEGDALHFGEFVQGRFEHGRDLAAVRQALGRGLRGRNLLQPVGGFVVGARGCLPLLAAIAGTNQIKRTVRADAVKPGAESGPAIESVKLFVRAQESFLDEVFGVLLIASHTESEAENGRAMPLYQDTKGMLIAFARLVGSGFVGPFHPAGL